MKIIAIFLAGAASLANAPEQVLVAVDALVSKDAAPFKTSNSKAVEEPAPICKDRIHTARAERGLPLLNDSKSPAEKGLLIAAVDHRLDGCSVLVMKKDTTDIRPIPDLDTSTIKLIPLQTYEVDQ